MDFDINTPEGMRAAVAWTEAHVERLTDGGIWGVPRSGTVLKIERSKKRVTVLMQMGADPALERVFREMGWTWVTLPASELN